MTDLEMSKNSEKSLRDIVIIINLFSLFWNLDSRVIFFLSKLQFYFFYTIPKACTEWSNLNHCRFDDFISSL
jgi:hypothetical protein